MDEKRRGCLRNKKKKVVAIKCPVCAVLMSAQAVGRDPRSAGEKRANLVCRCKWQEAGETEDEEEEQTVTGGQAESVPAGCGGDSWCRGDSVENPNPWPTLPKPNWLPIAAGEEVVCPLTTQSGRKTVVISRLALIREKYFLPKSTWQGDSRPLFLQHSAPYWLSVHNNEWKNSLFYS